MIAGSILSIRKSLFLIRKPTRTSVIKETERLKKQNAVLKNNWN
jgi:hypothetical protein